MAPRETENSAYSILGVTNKEYYGMSWYFLEWSIGYWEAIVWWSPIQVTHCIVSYAQISNYQ